MKFETRAIHEGQDPDPATGAVVTPIYQTSTYAQQAPGKHSGYEYSRTGNPTRRALEVCLASLESARFGFAFSSGMGAEDVVLRLLSPGDHVLVGNDVYGGTFRLLDKVAAPWGLEFSSVDTSSLEAVRSGLRTSTKMVWLESPTNPYLRLADIASISSIAHEAGALVVVDNTFATPYLQRPLELGADIVVHSTTKYLGGHSDVVGGAALTSLEEVAERLAFLQNATGAVPGPFDSWLVLRGLKTLGVRMRQHCENAMTVAQFLVSHDRVQAVYYPGLPEHPGHELAANQMSGFGGMVSFEVDDAEEMVCRPTLFLLGESLGGVESLIEHPASMTHLSVAGTAHAVSEELVRLSVGIEDVSDLIADLRTALGELV